MADADTRELFVKQVQAILPGARLDFMDEAHTAASLVAAAIKRGATVIAAGGGDGTINAVASELLAAERLNSKPRNSELIRAEIALGVLPLGTLNHFAGDMGIPEEMEAALGVLANGRVLSVDVGTVNNRIFLNNSGLGLYPEMVHNREQRQKSGASKWPAMIIESVKAFLRYRVLQLHIQVDGIDLQRRTPAVFVGNNDYSLEHAFAPRRTTITDGTLCLYIPHPKSRLGLVWFSLRAFFGNPTPGTDFDKFMATEFTIRSRHEKLRVSLDGEVTLLKTPLEYSVQPAALRVMVPPASTASTEQNGETA